MYSNGHEYVNKILKYQQNAEHTVNNEEFHFEKCHHEFVDFIGHHKQSQGSPREKSLD